MRYPLLALVCLSFVLLPACSDSSGSPPDRLIQLSVDWPMAREETFRDATLRLGTICLTSDCPRDQVVAFDVNGMAEVEFISNCPTGVDLVTKGLTASGKYDHAEFTCGVHIAPRLGATDYLKCTDEVQYIVVERPDDPECQPPPQ